MHAKRWGFTLVEVAIAIAVVAILALLLAPLLGSLADAQHAVNASRDLATIYRAIVGVPESGRFGYLGDVGEYPVTLLDLVRSRGQEGWNGPYLTEVYTQDDVLFDSFGSPVEYFYRTAAGAANDQLALISKGPDRGSSNLSTTPNQWMTYTGSPLPSSATYVSNLDNLDNIVYPRFTDHVGLLSYQNVGTLSLSIFNYDASLSRYVPGCPNLYEIKITSLARPTDTWGTSADNSTPTYTAGGATFDLLQGTYRVQVRMRLAPHGVAWEEIVTIAPGAVQAKTVYLAGADSSLTPMYTLRVTNNYAFGVTIYNSSGTSLGAAAGGGGTSGALSVRGCSPVTVRNTTTQSLVDAFTMPIGITTYNKRYASSSFTYTVTNNSGAYRYLFVYLNDLLIGEVSGWGSKKVKAFGGIKSGDQILIEDKTGNSRDGVVDVFADDGATF